MIRNGMRVVTPLGNGEVVGKESFYGGNLLRHLVRLDDPSRWAFGKETDVAAFFEKDVAAIEQDHLRDTTKMVPPSATR